jgi:hypothetical protein
VLGVRSLSFAFEDSIFASVASVECSHEVDNSSVSILSKRSSFIHVVGGVFSIWLHVVCTKIVLELNIVIVVRCPEKSKVTLHHFLSSCSSCWCEADCQPFVFLHSGSEGDLVTSSLCQGTDTEVLSEIKDVGLEVCWHCSDRPGPESVNCNCKKSNVFHLYF